MSQQTQAAPRPAWQIVAITAGALAAVVALLYLGVAVLDWITADQPQAQQPMTGQVQQAALADLPVYWQEQTSSADWRALAGTPSWDGTWLSVSTQLVADADAKQPATAMCAALSGYWISSGQEFHSVRVLDKSGSVLVSRRTLGEQCTWRR